MTPHESAMQRRRELGQAIVRLRKGRKLSQERLALNAGIDRSYMGRVERGERSVSLDKLWAICDALHISLAELAIEAETVHLGQDPRD
ncbi:helix-turn-helix domain-containing protein [Bifidobacterium vansinderenii]|uniref:DNA-binding protein n=1 Tax=Bifidobacterium vansinderenii TaxID=1984871 RepID=A0A229VXW8_9BIFI|nr:helix-turn-helix transcriptional regulator [Bifidobacterium vansinderenii]OXN00469.1 DNA-binding protein [Bifidobacterium vansinderenii]